MGSGKALRPGPRGAFTAELAEAYLALLRETGNARASARSLGYPYLFDNRKRYDPAFAAECEAAAREVDARLRGAESPFLPPLEVKSMPPPEGDEPGPAPRARSIKRTSNGRTQIGDVREGGWTPEIEAAFLARLRETGNFSASARAVGFSASTAYRRLHQWPAFARDCAEALEAAAVRLDYELAAHAHALLRRPDEAPKGEGELGTVTSDCPPVPTTAEDEGETETVPDDPPPVPFDPVMAMRILTFIDRRRERRTARGPRKGPPARRYEDARASILAKVEAIERHEERAKKQRGAAS